MKILESYKKMAKSMLTEHAWDRKFGEPLPTLDDVMREAEVDDKKMIKYKDKDGEAKEMPASSAKTMEKEHPAKIAYDKMADTGGEEEPKSKGLGKGDFERDFDDEEPEDSDEPFEKDGGFSTDDDEDDRGDEEPSGEPEDGEEPSGEPEGESDEKVQAVTDKVADLKDSHKGSKAQLIDDLERMKKSEVDDIQGTLSTETDRLKEKSTGVDKYGSPAFDNDEDEEAYWKSESAASDFYNMTHHYGDEVRYKPEDKEESISINGTKYREVKEHAWDRKFGEPLPTLADVMKVKEEKKVTKKHILREMYERIGGK